MRKELKQVSPNALATEANYYADPSQTMGEGEAYADVSMDTQGEDVPPYKSNGVTLPADTWKANNRNVLDEVRRTNPNKGKSVGTDRGSVLIYDEGTKLTYGGGSSNTVSGKGSSSNGSSSSSKSKSKQQQKPKKPMDAGKAPQEGQE